MHIGFIGYGEAAYNISLGLKQEGVGNIAAYDSLMGDPAMGKLISSRAHDAGVALVASAGEVASLSDVLFVAVPSTYTLGACEQVLPALRDGQLYVDVSASTPGIKEKIWEKLKDKNILFADAAMLGSLPKDKHRVPIMASGNGAKRFKELMDVYGMNISLAGEVPGAASAIKLIRSIYMKGCSALMIEMLQAADAYGVTDEVISSISVSMDNIPFSNHLNRLVTGSALHCVRRAAELKGSIELLSDKSISSDMTAAAKRRLEGLEPYGFSHRYVERKPKGWQEIIETIREE